MTTYDEIMARLAALNKEAREIAGPSITLPAVAAALASVPDEDDDEE